VLTRPGSALTEWRLATADRTPDTVPGPDLDCRRHRPYDPGAGKVGDRGQADVARLGDQQRGHADRQAVHPGAPLADVGVFVQEPGPAVDLQQQVDLDVLLSVDPAAWQQEADLIGEHLATFGWRLLAQLWEEHDALLERLKAAR